MAVSIHPEFLEQLLFSDEDATLDFKRDQYAFEGAAKEAKSELLKDILAFANAFRQSDAYILIGVEENRGARSEVVGIAAHLDDAKLQQFVNSKTQTPVTFSYREATHGGQSIGILHIPLQMRPVYATADYGKVKKDVVYVRHGSSTARAKPDEIARMGAPSEFADGQISVRLYLVDRETGRKLEHPVRVDESTWLEMPPEEAIPDYDDGNSMFINLIQKANANYFREVAAYAQANACLRIAMELENAGMTVVRDAKLGVELQDSDRNYELLGSGNMPAEPSASMMARLTRSIGVGGLNDVTVQREGEVWKVECSFGKIQPGSRARLQDDLLIGARQPGDLQILGKVYADNISSPIAVGIDLSFAVGCVRVDSARLTQIARAALQSGSAE